MLKDFSDCIIDGIIEGTNTYELNDGWCIDIVSDTEFGELCWEVWLYHSEYGIKEFMFGLFDSSLSCKEELADIIIANLENESYIDSYIAEYAPELM